MEIKILTSSDALWEQAIAYMKDCSWRGTQFLLHQIQQRKMHGWERILVAVEDEGIAGFCAVCEHDWIPDLSYTPFVTTLFVGEPYRGQRLSQRLIEAAASYVKTLGFDSIYLLSDYVGLYEKYGFSVIDQFQAPWGEMENLYYKRLEKHLYQPQPLPVEYHRLTQENFFVTSLDGYQRHQEIHEVLVLMRNKLVSRNIHYIEEWDLEQRRQVAKVIIEAIRYHGYAYGAFLNGAVVGFSFLGNELFGSRGQYVELIMHQVSNPYRNHGIGTKLFQLICKDAVNAGAERIYISANSSKETQAFYAAVGCTLAEEVNQEIAEKEPFDIQMEYKLPQL